MMRPYGSLKAQVSALHQQHPKLTALDIALQLGCGEAYVRKTSFRLGITLPGKRRKKSRAEILMEIAATEKRLGRLKAELAGRGA